MTLKVRIDVLIRVDVADNANYGYTGVCKCNRNRFCSKTYLMSAIQLLQSSVSNSFCLLKVVYLLARYILHLQNLQVKVLNIYLPIQSGVNASGSVHPKVQDPLMTSQLLSLHLSGHCKAHPYEYLCSSQPRNLNISKM